MSINYLYDYLPYTKGQLLLFTNENKTDSCVFTVKNIERYLYIDTVCSYNPMCDCAWGYGHAYANATFIDDDTTTYQPYDFWVEIFDESVFDRECQFSYITVQLALAIMKGIFY